MTREPSNNANFPSKSFRIDDLLGRKSVVNRPSPTVSEGDRSTAGICEKSCDSVSANAAGQHVGRESKTLGKINWKENNSVGGPSMSSFNFLERQGESEHLAKIPLIPAVMPSYSSSEPFSSYRDALYQRYNELLSGSLPISYYSHRLRESSVITSSYRRPGFLDTMLTSDDMVSAHPLDHSGMYVASLGYLGNEHQGYPMTSLYHSANKRKGGQIRFTNFQTSQLERSFVDHKYLNATDRKKLASSLGLSDRQVKTWFQNRRAKWRKTKDANVAEVEEEVIRSSPPSTQTYSSS